VFSAYSSVCEYIICPVDKRQCTDESEIAVFCCFISADVVPEAFCILIMVPGARIDLNFIKTAFCAELVPGKSEVAPEAITVPPSM